MLGCIAQGLLQVISLRYGKEVWTRHTHFLRTKSCERPSERTFKSVVTQAFAVDMHKVAFRKTMQELKDVSITMEKGILKNSERLRNLW